jgi:predicted nucleic-acid-binding Zn-ribbon protein
MKWGPCPTCGSAELFRSHPIDSGTMRSPNLLPGLGGFLHYASFRVVVCRNCGLTRFFADPQATDKLSSSAEWARVS